METLEKFCDVLIHRRRLLNRIWIHWINWINSGSGYPPRKRSKDWSKRSQRFDEGLCYSQGLCWAFGSSLEFVVAHLLWDWWTTASSLAVRQEVWSTSCGYCHGITLDSGLNLKTCHWQTGRERLFTVVLSCCFCFIPLECQSWLSPWNGTNRLIPLFACLLACWTLSKNYTLQILCATLEPRTPL